MSTAFTIPNGPHSSGNPSQKETNEYPNRKGRKELSLFAQDMVYVEGPKTYT